MQTSISQKGYRCKEYKKHDKGLNLKDNSKGLIYNKSTGLLYQFSNNDSILAVDIAVNDPVTQRKILMFGSKIWIDILGKKKKRRGVMFPMGMKEFEGMRPGGDMNRENRNGGKDPFNDQKHLMVKRIKNLEIIGVYEDINRVINSWSDDNIVVTAEFDELDMLYLRFEIPFTYLNLDYELLKYADLSFGYETGYMNMSEMQNRQSEPGGGGSAHPGGSGGGMRPGGPPGNGTVNNERMQMMQKMSEADKFWVKKVHLF